MKALTLTQPWATLVALGQKRIETRSWATDYRGPLAIHAAKGFPAWAKDLCDGHAIFRGALGWPDPPKPLTQEWIDLMGRNIKTLPLGCVVATARLVKVFHVEAILHSGYRKRWGLSLPPLTQQEQTFGDYSAGRFAWILDDVKGLPEPVPAKGALGLWEWEGTL